MFTQTKKFNKYGKLIEKGIYFGVCRIEKWLECDENGENCKIVDYEETRGRFSYNDVLKFLAKKKFLIKNPKQMEDQIPFNVKYSYEQEEWTITARYKNSLGYYTYILDGNTGKILNEEFISRY